MKKNYNKEYKYEFDFTWFHPERDEEYFIEAIVTTKEPNPLEQDSDLDYYGYTQVEFEVYDSSGNILSSKRFNKLLKDCDIEQDILTHFKVKQRYSDIEDCCLNNEF